MWGGELDEQLNLSKLGKVSYWEVVSAFTLLVKTCMYVQLVQLSLWIDLEHCRFSFRLQMIKAFLHVTRSRCCWLFKFGACYQLPHPHRPWLSCRYLNVLPCYPIFYFLITENLLKRHTCIALTMLFYSCLGRGVKINMVCDFLVIFFFWNQEAKYST